nr:glycosyltransferase family 4 protein [Bosea sp. ASV33]
MSTSLYPTPRASYTFGGAELFVRRVAERLVADGHEVEVIRSRPKSDGAVETVNGVTVLSAGRNNIYLPYGQTKPALARLAWHVIDDHVPASRLFAQRIEAFRPDILHSNTLVGLGTDIWRVARARRVPVVHTLHDYYLTCARGSRFGRGGICETTCGSCKVLTRGRRRKTRHVTALVGVSRRIVEIHEREKLFLDTPIKAVVRNASPALGTVAGVAPREADRPFSIGFMGRPHHEKGIRQLAQAVNRLPAGTVRLVIAGRLNEGEMASLRGDAPQADLTFLGYVKPEEFFGQVDIVVAPSLWEEPGALVIEEALAAGRPLIVSPYGGSPEAIEPGETGWIVEPEPDAMARLIASLAERPETVRAMQERLAKNTVHRTMAHVNEAYLDIYGRAIAAQRSVAG